MPVALAAQLSPPASGGVVALDRALQRLSEPRRLLMIAAHPDDEDTGLLTFVARGYGARAAYLALSRGEGGQNLIGPELGQALGLLRSRELLAAREIDGARQFFTRAYDFGFTRSPDETSALWPPDSILKDVVRIVRRFRPHVIVSVFSGTRRDGHGQHQAAGVAAVAAFDAAGDPARFPELATEEGLEPWTPQKLYRSTRFDAASTTLAVPIGQLDPRSGRSYYQIAMASRSRHRSQDMGRLQPIGPQRARVHLLADRTGVDSDTDDLFAGVVAPQSPVGGIAGELRSRVDPTNLAAVTPELIAVVSQAEPDERPELDRAIAVSAGIVTDAVAGDHDLVPGEAVRVTGYLFNGGPFDVAWNGVRLALPDGWAVEGTGFTPRRIPPGAIDSAVVTVRVPDDARPTQPYFLDNPRDGFLYDWSAAPPEIRGEPFQPPLMRAWFDASVLGASITAEREVAHRVREQARGEIRRALRVVPKVDVAVDPPNLVWPVDGDASRNFTVTLTYHGATRYAGEVGVRVDGWAVPAPQPFRFERTGETADFVFSVTRPAAVRDARVTVEAVVHGEDDPPASLGVRLVSYEHVRPTAWVVPAESRVVVAPIALPPVARIGYVRGAADRVPEALRQIGLDVTVLDEDELARADLSPYDAIVVGSRAYETDSALTRNNERLLAYVRDGGHLVVQYQQYSFVRGDYAPYPLDISRPHDRVTDETVPVRVLDPAHPVFQGPNPIGPGDWNDWPQERGLYFAGTWDDAYRPLLEMNDPGGPPLQGGLLVARYGSGTYVYTGLSFFRALPAGTPGAFRLFLNVLGLRPDHVP